MTTDQRLREAVDEAARSLAQAWPLHSFVTANPLAGFEESPFPEAVDEATRLFGGRGYPEPDVFERAVAEDRIDRELLADQLAEHGFDPDRDPQALLARLEDSSSSDRKADPEREHLDRIVAKWLGAFLDEGRTNWPMPDREEGFYHAFCAIAPHDSAVPDRETFDPPDDPAQAMASALDEALQEEWVPIVERELAALPGWSSLIKRREGAEDPWQEAAPVDLLEYVAVRLTLAEHLGIALEPPREDPSHDDRDLAEAFLAAWEDTYRSELVENVQASARAAEDSEERPETQLAFCIDTRSEVLRRHLETVGDHETHGYAGFFGVPIRYTGVGEDRAHGACPPIVDPAHDVHEEPNGEYPELERRYEETTSLLDAAQSMIVSLKMNPATAFPFVEHTGAGYGAALTARTLLPGGVRKALSRLADRVPSPETFCEPSLDGLALDAQIEYAASAFQLMGIDDFAPVFVFVGHRAETANNPFDASLDCGACAGNPGGPNARVLAKICNREPVREALRDRGIDVPEDTVFLAGEHNTTTDEVELFTNGHADAHPRIVDDLEADLAEAGKQAAAERLDVDDPDEARAEACRRAADWSQTRPEWGLAGNAAFVIGRRKIPANLDLDGRAFLHSYDWRTDDEGDALEAIFTGPWVVTEWINMQYYFASVDNATWGSGSKVTQTPVGNNVVAQGNGGDVGLGLPRESLVDVHGRLQHQPLRLATVVEAPVERVQGLVAEHAHLDDLVANDWLTLTVLDPERGHAAYRCEGNGQWVPQDAEGVTLPESLDEVAEPVTVAGAENGTAPTR